MAFPVLASVIGAGLGALYTKASGGSNRDLLKNMLIGGTLGTGAGYLAPGMFGSAAAAKQAALGGAAGPLPFGKAGLAANIKALPTSVKVAGCLGLASLAATPKPFEPKPIGELFDKNQYQAAYDEQRENVQGLGDRFDYSQVQEPNPDLYSYNQDNPLYTFAKGGIVEATPGFKEGGGVQYLPSKLDHDEKDVSNYVRAAGYIEDATDIADKDKDTMLAQLADGEFVSRADAILGAGIMQGADPKDIKDMRAKGAKFFYNQQDQLKRIYDLVT